jgi:hypothetical protein
MADKEPLWQAMEYWPAVHAYQEVFYWGFPGFVFAGCYDLLADGSKG